MALTVEGELEALFGAVQQKIDATYRDGFAAGYAAAVEKLFVNVQAMIPGDAAQAVSPVVANAESASTADTVRLGGAARAPRGLVEQLLEAVLSEKPGLTIDEVEAAVAAKDSRVAPKTVYNTLRRYEKEGKRFRRHNGQRWYRVADIPPPWAGASSPQGETGGMEPPASSNQHV